MRRRVFITRHLGTAGQRHRAGAARAGDRISQWRLTKTGCPACRRARALLVAADPLYFNQGVRIAALAAQYKIPAFYLGREYAVAGGLLSQGPSISDVYRRIGVYVGRILGGARPQELRWYRRRDGNW